MMDSTVSSSPRRRKSRKSWIDSSPVANADIAREETLLLTHFTKKPTISFGKVKVGKTISRKLFVTNPHEFDQLVHVEKFPHEEHFEMDLMDFEVPAESTLSLNISWTPERDGGCRQMILFFIDESYRLQAVLYGTAIVPRQKKVATRGIMSDKKIPFSVLHTPNLANLKTYGSSEIQYKIISSKRNQYKTISDRENTEPACTRVVAKDRLSANQCNVEENACKEKNDSVSCMNGKNSNLELEAKDGSLQEISSFSEDVTRIPYGLSPKNKTIEIDSVEKVLTHGLENVERNLLVESNQNAAEYQHSYVTIKRQKNTADEVIGPSFCKQSPRRETYLVKKQKRRSWKNKLKTSPTSSDSLPVVTFSPPQLSPCHVYDNSIKNISLDTDNVMSSPIHTNFLLTSSPIEIHQHSIYSNRSNLLLQNQSSGSSFQDVLLKEYGGNNTNLEILRVVSELAPIENQQPSPKSDNGLSSDSLNSKNSSHNSEIVSDFHQTPMLSTHNIPHVSGRSTHVIKEPKILCKTGGLKKSLFSPAASVQKVFVNCKIIKAKPSQMKERVSLSSKMRAAKRVTKSTETPCDKTTKNSIQKKPQVKRSFLSPKKPAVAQSRLMLGKREKTVIPKHPMPFASKNIYYDERWMQKQEWSFTHWFNYILTPVEEYKIRKCVKVDAKALLFNTKQEARLAPSKEVLSFESYAARKRLNRLRKLACKMFQTKDVVKVVQRLEVEIDSQRLIIRQDRPVHADIGLKQKILNWILSYNSLWLRIGLEVVFGEILLIDSNTDFLGLSRFIVTRLLGNPDIANQFAHPTVPHLYREGYQAALSKHTLKKYLILVFFLDYAKRKRLIEHDPCLFCKDAEIKASKELLFNVAREFLKGEGDVTRHLSYFGYTVSYVQTPLHEFDYAVSNLAVDLRDGIRLTRAIEILTGKWELTESLRAPAISRLQKVHNVDKVLKALLENGMDLSLSKDSICAKDIVDGHREKTLTLLWRIVTSFQVDILLDIDDLRDEVQFLNRCLEKKRCVRKLAGAEDYTIKRNSLEELLKPENEKHLLLFEWCQAVSAHYGLQIENFTVSFSDGRILCYLIHHYYPGLLPLSEIKQNTTVTYINEIENQQDDSDQSLDELTLRTWFSPKTGKPKIYEALLANEAENFKLIAKKVSAIGGVPAMLRHSDMSNTIPDEKVVITYVTYLAIRLLEIRHESRAAIVIQMAWRKYVWRKRQRLQRMKSKSAVVTQWQCSSNTMNKIQILSLRDESYDKARCSLVKDLSLSPSQSDQKHDGAERNYLPKCNLDTIAEVSCLETFVERSSCQRGTETHCESPLNLVIHKLNGSNDLDRQNLNAREKCIGDKTSVKLNQTVEFEREDSSNFLNGTFEINYNSKPHHSHILNQTIDIGNAVESIVYSTKKSREIATEDIGVQPSSNRSSLCSLNKCLEDNQNLNDDIPDRNVDLNDRDNINEGETGNETGARSRSEISTALNDLEHLHVLDDSVDSCHLQKSTKVHCDFTKDNTTKHCDLPDAYSDDCNPDNSTGGHCDLPDDSPADGHYDLPDVSLADGSCDLQGDIARCELDYSVSHFDSLEGDSAARDCLAGDSAACDCLEGNSAARDYLEGDSAHCLEGDSADRDSADHDSADRLEGGSADRLEGDSADRLEGDSADCLEGDSADRLEGGSADYREGDSADCLEGDSADRLEGDSADRLEGDSADRLEGDSADCLEGDSADCLEGDSADCLEGNSADCLEGDSADYREGDSAERDSADRLEGDSADCREGDSADRLEGDSADRLEGDSADRLEGNSADCLESDSADCREGDSADCLEGETADCLEGDSADCLEGDSSDCLEGDSADYREGDSAERDSADCLEGDSADCREGDSADCREGDSADCREGDSADCREGDSADYREGDSADCLEGDSADCREGDSAERDTADCLEGDFADCREGDFADCQEGDSADCLEGDSAERDSADCLEGDSAERDSADCLEGDSAERDSADCLEGDSADYREGDSADYREGDSADCLEGDSANRLEGDSAERDSADCLEGDSADCLEGDSADCLEGDFADCLEGDSVDRLEGDSADCLEGDSAHRLEGDSAHRLEGDSAHRLEGDSADCLEGDSADRLEGDSADCLEGDSAIGDLESFTCSDFTANITMDVNNSNLVDYEKLSSSECDSDCLSQVEHEQSDTTDGIHMLNTSKINPCLQTDSEIVFKEKSLILQNQIDEDSRPNILNMSKSVLEQQCAIVIQRWYRNLKESRHVASDYQKMKSAAIILQSFYRMYSQHRKYHKQLDAICFLQATVRMHQKRQNYRSLCRSTIQIQRWYRGISLCKSQRKKFLKEKQACIQIQSIWRGVMQRQLLKSQVAAAIVIQSHFKKYCCQSRYLKLHSSAILIQKLYRSKLESRKLQMQFLQELQEKHQEEKRRNNAAQLIQATWKCYMAQKKFSKLKAATCILQRYISAYLIGKRFHRDFITQKNAAVKIQSNLRGFIARRRYRNIIASVSLIQALFRGYQVRTMLQLKHCSAVIIQSHWRAYLAKIKFQADKRTIIRIQALVRAKQQQKKYLDCKNAAIVIQQWYRSTNLMRQCNKYYLKLKKYTMILQDRFRALRSMKICRQQFLQKRIAIIRIQAYVRQFLAKHNFCKQKQSVILLQNWFRACKAAKTDRAYYLSLKTHTIKMQACIRRRQQRKTFLELKYSALKIQTWYRAVISMRSDQEKYIEYRIAVVKIQSAYRCHRTQQKFIEQKQCVIKLQQWWRSTLNMRVERKSYLSKQVASRVIQRWFQSLIAMKQAREDYLKVRASVITIQSYLRQIIQERHFKTTKSSVIKIQQWYRACVQMEIERKNYCCLKTSTVFLQSVIRMKLERKSFLTLKSSAIKIQRWYRRMESRRQLKETIARRHIAATFIQNWFKRAVAAKRTRGLFNINCDCCTAPSLVLVKASAEYWLLKTRTKKLNAVCTIQKYCRYWLHHRHQAATVIQSFTCGWLVRKSLAKQRAAAIVIQANIRAFYARKLFEKKRSAILIIEFYLQQYLKKRDHSARVIQRAMKGWLVRKHYKKLHQNATLIQCYWRGYKVRCHSTQAITRLRHRLLAVTKEATEDKKLISRFVEGFDQLMKFKQLSDVLYALVNLEAASRLSPVCCLQLARSNGVPVIYNIIKGCNRSVPHMELIKYSIQIFLNLAKYAPTIESVYYSHPDAINIILKVMTVFREKGLVFSKSCILLGSIALDLKEKGKMDELLSRKQFVEKIMSLYKLTDRKYKQEENRVVTRARLVAAKDSCQFYENVMLSKIGPEWLLGKKKLQEFKEPFKAMTYLMHCLGLQNKLPKPLSKKI